MNRVGIEKINIYGSSLCLEQKELAQARGRDPEKVLRDFYIDTRSLNPPYEDTVTMGANAAKPILTEEDKKSIGLIIVGTEGSVDFGKPISTNIQNLLGLPNTIRSYETKHACYSGVAALDAAINWIASGLNKGKKALVIASDFSRKHLGFDHEFVLGGSAAAVLISETPKILEYETAKKGSYSSDVYDTFRPTARVEMGNNEVSLYSYQEGVEGAYMQYLEQLDGPIDFETYFQWNIYHMPFPGMALLGHRVVCKVGGLRKKSEIEESFARKVLPSLHFARRVGSTYGASNFVGLCGLLASADVHDGDRVGFFSYGSGFMGEFYSGIILPGAKKQLLDMRIDKALDLRRQVTVTEYERIEELRDSAIEAQNYIPDFSVAEDWYAKHYEGKGFLVLKEVKDYYRKYEWS
ncbi:MAG: hydroxymethylglutaryl-CoA synthase [Spirochaetota bacterium]|jgi:hydroxymethylglutaryl-CoA synthase|nr:hydroxymethylglutaryl-CoA synthase [Spirochaetota bacterium]